MAGKMIADTIEGTTNTETVGGVTSSIPNSVDVKYVVNGSAKARIRYNQDTSTNVDSYNVSSYTDSTSGKSIVAFLSAMDNATYNAITDGTNTDTSSAYDQTHSEAFTSSQFQVSTGVYSTGAITTDFVLGQAVVFGDLA